MNDNYNLLKNNFTSGEITPYMLGRDDINKYANGAAELENFLPRVQGGLSRRMGTRYLGEVENSANATILIPFEFSNSDAFVLEFGDQVMRVWKDLEIIMDGGSPYEEVTPYSSSDLSLLYYAQSADVLYIAHPEYPPYKISRVADNNWTIEEAEFEDGPYVPQVTADLSKTMWLTNISYTATITSTVAEFVVGDVNKFIEYWKNGVLVLGQITAYVNTTTVTIEPKDNVVDSATIDPAAVVDYAASDVRSSLAIWSSTTEYSYIKVGSTWYYMTVHDPIPIVVGVAPNSYSADIMTVGSTPTMKTVTGKLTYSDQVITAKLNSSSATFDSTRDIGRGFRLIFSNRPVWGKITSYETTKRVVVSLGTRVPTDPRNGQDYINNATTTDWRLGAWYVGNYPRTVTFHQGRLLFAGTTAETNRLWMSVSDDYVSFAPTTNFNEVIDASAINVGIVSSEVNSIVWAQSGPVLLIGTTGEEFQIKPTNIGEALTPSNINVTAQTPYGSEAGCRPVKIGPSTLFLQEHGTRLRELTYSFEIDSFVAADLTIISEHILRKHTSAVQIIYQQTPNSVIWIRCEDGSLVSLTYEKAQEVFAWANHFTEGVIESMAVVPSRTLKQDIVYMVILRTIDGNDVRYLESFSKEFFPSTLTDKTDMLYLDSAVEYSGVATSTITGLDHLEGQEVGVLANKSVHPECTVVGGSITLSYPSTHAYVGLSFTSKVRVLPLQQPTKQGTSQGKLRKIIRVDANLLDSIGLRHGRVLDDMFYPRSFRDSGWTLGQSPDLFTGVVQLTDESGFNRDSQFYIVQDQPYPLNLLSLMPIIKINE